MTKRRREKITTIMSCSAYKYVERGKFEYLKKQTRLYRKHEMYLYKMNKRSFNRTVKRLLKELKETRQYDADNRG